MFISNAMNYLTKVGYQKQVFKEPSNVSFASKLTNGVMNCVIFVDEVSGMELTINQTHGVAMTLVNHFEQSGYEVHPLLIFVTENPTNVKERVWMGDHYWIADTKSEKLIIYEGQPGSSGLEDILRNSFDGVYGVIKPQAVKKANKKFVLSLITANNALILVNIFIYGITELLGDTTNNYYMFRCGALYPAIMGYPSQWYRFLMAAFLHFGLSHIFNNMLVLAVVGPYVEKKIGWWKYVILYLLVGIGANIVSYYWYMGIGKANIVSAGASGAVFGVIGALLYIVIRNKGKLENLTTSRIVFMIILSLYEGFTSYGTNNTAHVSGLVIGFVLAVLLYHKKSAGGKDRVRQ